MILTKSDQTKWRRIKAKLCLVIITFSIPTFNLFLAVLIDLLHVVIEVIQCRVLRRYSARSPDFAFGAWGTGYIWFGMASTDQVNI